ncbi:trypsin-like peptidase domain-containing protein, partial [Enterococcus faecium]|uniref:trypsin-like peptidase domain-containing protein n=1 Tax=Enterococcus faecium TaxID=1352 RepID=UPI003F4449C5
SLEPGKPFSPRSTIRVNGTRAEFLAADPGADVAFISVKSLANMPRIEVGASDNLQNGQTLYSIGFPARSKVPLMSGEQVVALKVVKHPRLTDLDA